MPTKRELLLSLRDGFEKLDLFDDSELNALRDRGRMIVRRAFGPDSPYAERLSSIEFYYTPFITVLGEPETAAEGASRERKWRSGQRESVSLINTMIEDLELGEAEQSQGLGDASTAMKSDRVFVVHGHDGEMREAVARVLSKLGLEPVILHEQPDRGRTIIERFYDYSDVGFAVVLLSPDDMGYVATSDPRDAKPRARQNVLLDLGFFPGKLGRENVVALHKGATEIPSDFSGVLFKPYVSGGDWPYKLTRELRESGYEVSADDL